MYVFMGILIYLMIGLLNVILITSVGMTVSKLEPFKRFRSTYCEEKVWMDVCSRAP